LFDIKVDSERWQLLAMNS